MTELISPLPDDCKSAAEVLNRDCACISLDHAALEKALGEETFYRELRATRPHLFSDSVVFVGRRHMQRMAELVAAIEEIVALPAWQERVLGWAPQSAKSAAHRSCAARGVFLGYDFHIGDDGPKLIEINTNAGGGLLNARLATAQRACCDPVAKLMPKLAGIEDGFVAMFREEWRLAGGQGADRPLQRVAIVDEKPAEQYLAPEFELFRRLFEASGIKAVIADPAEFVWDGSQLLHGGQAVDLVYNRLTDFSLDDPANAALRAAWEQGATVITPHPRAHALYADKRNLVALGDAAWLADIGVPAEARQLIADLVPATVAVTAAEGERFWAERKRWFFKPAAGYGSKAAYRGDKLTKRVFEEILQGGYIAQALVPPSERRLQVAGEAQQFKLDLRNYAYAGKVQLVVARLYQGQTTNFRTPGGGFAPVFEVPGSALEQRSR
jgi:glutathione synthase/RimK-type ligase-like ATP-grasp enzyme